MALIDENSSICIKCEDTTRFCSSNENEKRRHVAIVHGKETFSSLRCGKCEKKYYDFNHFAEHLQASPECRKNSWMIKPEPLSAHLEMAFAALVDQMMRPRETDQKEKAPISSNLEFKLRRQQYCMELIEKFSTAGKLRCQLCSAECFVIRGKKENRGRKTASTIQHAMGHLKKPTYRCQICNVTKFTVSATRYHTNVRHSVSGGFEDCSDQYHQEIMDTMRLCFHVDRKKRPVEQVNTRLAIRGRCYDDARSVLYNERLHYVRCVVSHYSNQTRIVCQLCSRKCARNAHDANMSIRNHVMVHLNKDIFQCRTCGIGIKSLYQLKTHFVQYHQTKRIEGAYVDYCDKYHHEFLNMLGKCFDPDSGDGAANSKKKAGSGISEGKRKSPTSGSNSTTGTVPMGNVSNAAIANFGPHAQY